MKNKYYEPRAETWRDVVGYEDQYEVSSFGNVRRKIQNLKLNSSVHGYYNVSLSKNGECTTKLVHRLVAEAFLDNSECKEQVNHKDCNKLNNEINNLEWVTPQENITHAVLNERQRDQRGEDNNMSKLTEKDVLFIMKLKKSGYTTYKIHKEFYPYLHQQTIYGITSGKTWKHL